MTEENPKDRPPTLPTQVRVGVYADVPNTYRNGGQRLQYDVLRQFAARDYAEPLRLNAYVTFDTARAERDETYREGALSFHGKLRDYGFKVVVKEVQTPDLRGLDEEARAAAYRGPTASPDVDLAVDALLQSENLDRIVLASGNGDFLALIHALQSRGCRVELVGLDHTAPALKDQVDLYVNGYLIPGLVPISRGNGSAPAWGTPGSRVRAVCYWYEQERGFGYMRFLKAVLPGLWYTDARHRESPYATAFFRDSSLPHGVRAQELPHRQYVFEMTLEPSDRGEGFTAVDLELVSRG